MKTLICCLVLVVASMSMATEPVASIKEWNVSVGSDSTHDLRLVTGETTFLRPRFTHNGMPLNLQTVWTVDLLARESGTTNLPYALPGHTLVETNGSVEVVVWTTNALPEGIYDYAIVVGAPTTTLAKAVGQIEVIGGLAAETATNWPSRVTVFDCSDVVYLNIGDSPWLSSYNVQDIQDQLATIFNGTAHIIADTVTANELYGSAVNLHDFPPELARTNQVPSGVVTNMVSGGQDANPGVTQISPGTWRITFPLSSEGETTTTNRLLWIVEGQTIGYVSTNGITMVKGSLFLQEEDLECNVRAYDGSKTYPSISFQGGVDTGWYRKSIFGGSGWTFASEDADVMVLSKYGIDGYAQSYLNMYQVKAGNRFSCGGVDGVTTNFDVVSSVLTNGAGAVTGVVTRTIGVRGGIITQ